MNSVLRFFVRIILFTGIFYCAFGINKEPLDYSFDDQLMQKKQEHRFELSSKIGQISDVQRPSQLELNNSKTQVQFYQKLQYIYFSIEQNISGIAKLHQSVKGFITHFISFPFHCFP